MSLSKEANLLLDVAHRLLYFGMDDTPIYSDDLARLSSETFRRSNALYNANYRGATPQEEALLCLALLMGYNATMWDDGNKSERVQHILDRCWQVLGKLDASLLKVRLLTYCYGEVYEEELLTEANQIVDNWNTAILTPQEQRAIEELRSIAESSCQWEVVEEAYS